MLSKPDGACSSFPLQQFLEMMSLFIKNRKKKNVSAPSARLGRKVERKVGRLWEGGRDVEMQGKARNKVISTSDLF